MGLRWGWEVKKGACHHREFIRPDEGAHPTGTFPPRCVYESLVGKIAEQSGALKVKWLIPFLYKESRNMVRVTDWVSSKLGINLCSRNLLHLLVHLFIHWFLNIHIAFSLRDWVKACFGSKKEISLELTSLKGELCEKRGWKKICPPSNLLEKGRNQGTSDLSTKFCQSVKGRFKTDQEDWKGGHSFKTARQKKLALWSKYLILDKLVDSSSQSRRPPGDLTIQKDFWVLPFSEPRLTFFPMPGMAEPRVPTFQFLQKQEPPTSLGDAWVTGIIRPRPGNLNCSLYRYFFLLSFLNYCYKNYYQIHN